MRLQYKTDLLDCDKYFSLFESILANQRIIDNANGLLYNYLIMDLITFNRHYPANSFLQLQPMLN